MALFSCLSRQSVASERSAFLRYCVNHDQPHLAPYQYVPVDPRPYLRLKATDLRADDEAGLDFESQTALLQNILADYLNTYLHNQQSFAPYASGEVTSHQQEAVMLYKDLCQGEHVKGLCRPYREKIVSFFERHLKAEPLKSKADVKKQNLDYLDNINEAVASIRAAYTDAHETIDRAIHHKLFANQPQPGTPSATKSINKALAKVFARRDVATKVQRYQDTYLSYARSAQGMALLSQTIFMQTEGRFFDIQFADLVRAIDEVRHELRHDLVALLTQNPQVLHLWSPSEGGEPAGVPPLRGDDQRQLQEACETALARRFQTSTLYPAYARPKNMPAVARFHGSDLTVLRFLLANDYMRAIWRLRALGHNVQADELEEWLQQGIFKESQVQLIKPLGGGFTTTKKVYFPSSVKGVYKVQAWRNSRLRHGWQNLMDSIVSRPKKEIAAYKLDKYLGLNLVPLTRPVFLADGAGSLQYFINNATSARLMNEVDPVWPVASHKWSTPHPRIALPHDAQLFDWLIDNRDRNIDNYLFTSDGQLILIDHGWTFVSFTVSKPSEAKIKAMLPSRELYTRLKMLHDDTDWLESEIRPLLRAYKFHLLKKRMRYVVEAVDAMISLQGEQEVFSAGQ